MINQGVVLPDDIFVTEIKSKVNEQNESAKPRRAVPEATVKGASSRLSVQPLEEFGFCLNKGEFRDSLKLRYAKELVDSPPSAPVTSSTMLIKH